MWSHNQPTIELFGSHLPTVCLNGNLVLADLLWSRLIYPNTLFGKTQINLLFFKGESDVFEMSVHLLFLKIVSYQWLQDKHADSLGNIYDFTHFAYFPTLKMDDYRDGDTVFVKHIELPCFHAGRNFQFWNIFYYWNKMVWYHVQFVGALANKTWMLQRDDAMLRK